MIRTTLTFRMPTLRLVGTLLILAVLAGLPTSAWAEFRIGVWQPAGHLASDVSFNHITVADLNSLGVDLLINTPNEVGITNGRYQLVEENIMSQLNDAGKGFVVQHAPEGHRLGYPWRLERYAGSLCARDHMFPIMSSDRRNALGAAVDSLVNKWTDYDEFYGYRIGHEADYCGGVYDSRTYANMSTVIDSIRAYDTEHRIIAVGNTMNTDEWTPVEQTSFRRSFFRPNTDPSPANIFMQEVYILADGNVSETSVQGEFDDLRDGLDSIGTMVDSALIENRKAEWHFIVQVTRTNRDMTSTRPAHPGLYRHPTLPELKAQVNMALSRGAKGVTYFTYTSSNGYVWNYEYDGLVDLNRNRRQPIWDTVQTVNDTLRTLGDALYPLTWDAGFSFSTRHPLTNSTLVNAVRPSTDHAATAGSLEFGLFHDDDADYVLVVNRHNLTITPRRSQTIDLRFDTQQMQTNHVTGGSYCVKEIVTGVENAYVADASNHIWVTGQTLAPGDARLYRIERMEVPDAPQEPVATTQVGSIKLGWELVSTIPSVSEYQVQYQRAQVGSSNGWSDYVDQATIFHETNTSYTHSNDEAGYVLNPGYRYRYRVRAQNAECAGLWSDGFPTDGAIVQAEEPRLAGLVLDDESIGLVANWTCPNRGFCASPQEGQTAPLRLQAEIKSGSAEEWSVVETTVSGEQTTHSVEGLSRRVVHQFRTRAVNADNEAGWASKAVALVPLRTQVGTGEDQVVLDWDAPDGYGVLAWQYRYKATSSATWGGWQGVSTSGVTSQTVSGLTDGVNYQFQVQAVSGGMARVVSFIESVPAGTDSPVFPSSGTVEKATVGQYFSFTRPSASGGNAPLTYSVSGSCAGLTATSSSISGSPSSTGDCTISWTVTDTDGDTDTYELEINVKGDTSPVFPEPEPAEAIVGQYFSFTRPSASGGNAPLTYSVGGSCDGLWTTSSSVSGAPRSTGDCTITWTVTDSDGDTDTYELEINVATDTSPDLPESDTAEAIVGQYFSFTRPSASGGNAPLTYSVSGSCDGLTANSSSVSGSPSSTGQCGISWTVTDNDGDTDTFSLQVSVRPASALMPVFNPSSASESATVGQYFSFTRPAASGGNAPLTYSVSGSCDGLIANSSSISGSPSSTGACTITWTVTDNDGDTDTYELEINVGSASDPMPSFSSSGTSKSATVGQYFSFTRPSASGGNAPLTYSVSGSCAGLTATSSSVSGSPSSTGQCGFTWTVTDNDGDTDTYSLQISVSADTSPSFSSSGTSKSATEGQYFSFTRPSASGGNAPLTYSVSGSCAGLTATSSSVSGSPSSTGQCGFTWTVTDNDGDTDTYSLQISVSARTASADTTPVFSGSGTRKAITAGVFSSFNPLSARSGNSLYPWATKPPVPSRFSPGYPKPNQPVLCHLDGYRRRLQHRHLQYLTERPSSRLNPAGRPSTLKASLLEG